MTLQQNWECSYRDMILLRTLYNDSKGSTQHVLGTAASATSINPTVRKLNAYLMQYTLAFKVKSEQDNGLGNKGHMYHFTLE